MQALDKRQILALLGREGFCSATHARHTIQLFVRASSYEEAEMNVRYRVELSQAERAELTTLLSPLSANSSEPRYWWRPTRARVMTSIDNPKRLASEIAAWERQRNAAKARINWMFTTEKARAKLGPAYPDTSKKS